MTNTWVESFPIWEAQGGNLDNYLQGLILSFKRGKIREIVQDASRPSGKLVLAEVPFKELVGYSTALRSMTKGNASFSMEFKEYGEFTGNEEAVVLKQIRGF